MLLSASQSKIEKVQIVAQTEASWCGFCDEVHCEIAVVGPVFILMVDRAVIGVRNAWRGTLLTLILLKIFGMPLALLWLHTQAILAGLQTVLQEKRRLLDFGSGSSLGKHDHTL
ncbi:hypothetical protein NPIL_464521 [Nephila pilipes]|uniref:Uncharacterized protein n=1 Tax=Nephila pilipes TaxID=299642 RepID=A0A8X6N5U0_NEPPI|nr:hypothetical protein NPIL_464521 [Nephila pilipes]